MRVTRAHDVDHFRLFSEEREADREQLRQIEQMIDRGDATLEAIECPGFTHRLRTITMARWLVRIES